MLGIKRNSLSYKTTIIYVVLAILIISVFNFIIWENQSALIIENQRYILESKAASLREIIREFPLRTGPEGKPNFDRIAQGALDEDLRRTVVFSEAGDRYFEFNSDPAFRVDYEGELVIINRAISRNELENKPFLHKSDARRELISLYMPSTLEGGEVVVFKFVLPMVKIQQKKNELLRICAFIAVVVGILTLLVALWLRQLIILPISRLVRLTLGVSQGKFRQQIAIRQNDEIGVLASAFNEMTISLEKMQQEAKEANPLSGLPGNISIMNNIDQRLKRNEEIAIIYGDLDNFKAYNDKYGLTKGDDAILHTRDCFVSAVREAGDPTVFVGHEGGDDFVCVAGFENWETICKLIVTKFDAGISKFYSESDFRQGYIDSMDRQGNRQRFPLMSISLAVVSNHYRAARDHRTLIAWAAEMKKVVKKMEGSNYAIDKRHA